jgi:cardiolipin synthase
MLPSAEFVVLLFDWGGSYQLRNKHLKEFREANGIFIEFHNVLSSWRKRRWIYPLVRDHRKLLIVDNEIAFCGGMNIAADYAGPEVGGNGRFRDTHAEVRGPGVIHLANVFFNSLKRAMDGTSQWKEVVQYKKFLEKVRNEPPAPDPNGVFLQVLESDAWAYKRHIQNSIALAIERARSHIYITTPYFLPPPRLKETIVRAAQRGVKVFILTAGKCDVPFINLAAQHVYETFLRHGVVIYEMVEKELHAKTTTIDGLHNFVGSFNLDDLSYHHMLEVNLVSLDTQGAKNLEEQFRTDLKWSKQVTLQSWTKRSLWRKIVTWFVYQLCRAAFA